MHMVDAFTDDSCGCAKYYETIKGNFKPIYQDYCLYGFEKKITRPRAQDVKYDILFHSTVFR